jgi:hypothetical protein
MEEKITDVKIDSLKPRMKALPSFKYLQIVRDETVVQVKADGEFTLLNYSEAGSCTVNLWGRARLDFPALNEFHKAMQGTGVKDAKLLCELYAMEGGRPLKLPDYIHYVKSGKPELLEKVRIGVFDLLSVDGSQVQQSYAWKLEEVGGWLSNCRLCHVLPYAKPSTLEEVEAFWRRWVEETGYEGLVARSNGDLYKVKPFSEVDAVIIGINKKKLFWSNRVTSVVLALMDDQGRFVEIGDCASGIDREAQSSLWKLVDFKVMENSEILWVKPLVVCTVRFTDLFKGKNTVYVYDEKHGYLYQNLMDFVRLRHPRLICFRPDKKVTPVDLRMEQIPMDFWRDVWAVSKALGK